MRRLPLGSIFYTKHKTMSIHFGILDSITESMAVINNSGEILFTNKAWRAFSSDKYGRRFLYRHYQQLFYRL